MCVKGGRANGAKTLAFKAKDIQKLKVQKITLY